MTCPNCGAEAALGAVECAKCSVIFAKWQARQNVPAPAPSPVPAASASGLGLGTLLGCAAAVAAAGFMLWPSPKPTPAPAPPPVEAPAEPAPAEAPAPEPAAAPVSQFAALAAAQKRQADAMLAENARRVSEKKIPPAIFPAGFAKMDDAAQDAAMAPQRWRRGGKCKGESIWVPDNEEGAAQVVLFYARCNRPGN